jgi:multidrug resistance efflux pump
MPRSGLENAIKRSKEDMRMNVQEELEKFRTGLLQQRDELLVQLNLAKLEAREEWEKAEAKLEELKAKLEELKAKLDSATEEAKEASEDVWSTAKLLGEEIKAAYDRIKSHL